ncbi:MAG TPA: hypothetical protein VL172_16370 [Kofleriaceae bacterium]|nr:hypothetical protein [Kofleriaceae bacterium]
MPTPVDPLATTQPIDVLADTIQMRRPHITVTSSFTRVDADWFDSGETGRGLAVELVPAARPCPLARLRYALASLAAAAVVVAAVLL